ncbi:MAG: LysM peptidoglycan-binding domain-containing protein [Parachlamydiales bacterium]|nr:LysM peptidoglycan-binding domain-containing protein [Parachlamydiales bacterium]
MKNTVIKYFSFAIASIFLASCTPMKSSPKEEKHQMELTLHELQTNLDDLRHDLNCFQTELQIIDGKIKHQEDATQNIKQQHIERLQVKNDSLNKLLINAEAKLTQIEQKQNAIIADLKNLSNYSNETTLALTQHKEKINELEASYLAQGSKINEIASVKTTLQQLVKSLKSNSFNCITYKVKSGDSLEKIAKQNNVSVDSIKKINDLDSDLIVIGQELKIPN